MQTFPLFHQPHLWGMLCCEELCKNKALLSIFPPLRGIFANFWFILWNYIFPPSVILSLTGQRTFWETCSSMNVEYAVSRVTQRCYFLKMSQKSGERRAISCAIIPLKGQVSPGQCFDYSASRWKLYPSSSIFSYSQRTLRRRSQPS